MSGDSIAAIQLPITDPFIEIHVNALAQSGWCVTPGFLNEAEISALRAICQTAQAEGEFHAAGVGRHKAQIVSEVRGDFIRWIDAFDTQNVDSSIDAQNTINGPAMQSVLQRLEDLRIALNQALFLGLFDVELHFAAYPPGAGYLRHVDRFRDDDRRTLTVILYLNPPDWQTEDGGMLRFWPTENGPPVDISPQGGTLVTFLSERFWHQVMPTRRERFSLTGWFRRR